MSLFPPEIRTLAIIPRWCIVQTTTKDYVASHSYFVALYSRSIAEVIRWRGNREYLLMAALMHDHDESITGDITGPVKNTVVGDRAPDFLFEKSQERMGSLLDSFHDLEDSIPSHEADEANSIVMVADKLDALLFLIFNRRMGNTFVEPAIEGGMKSLEGAWRRLPGEKELLDKAWQTIMVPAIEEHETRGARGCAPGVVI